MIYFKTLEICLLIFKNIKISWKEYNEISNEGYFPEADIQYLKNLYELHNNLSLLLERMKIEKFEKLHDKIEYLKNIRNLKQASNHGLSLKTVHKVIKLRCLKPYIGINIDLRKKVKNDFEKDFSKLMNNYEKYEKTQWY